MSANKGHTGRGEESTSSFVGSVTSARRKEVAGPTPLEEGDDIGLSPRWTRTEYRQELGTMMDIVRFSAMVVDIDSFVMYD